MKKIVRFSARGSCSYLWLLALGLTVNIHLLHAQGGHTTASATAQVQAIASGLVFEKNIGQHESSYQYVARDKQATYFFMTNEVRSTVVSSTEGSSFSYGFRFVNASPDVRLHGIGPPVRERSGQHNVLQGGTFIQNIPRHEALRYADVWHKIHVVFNDSEEGMKYDFVVQPGGNPAAVQFELMGVSNLRLTSNGELAYTTPLGELVKGRPFTYQYIDGRQVIVESSYVLNGNKVGFQLGTYDPNHSLTIDPVALKWATMLGGGSNFEIFDVKLDPVSNKLYLTGSEQGIVYPSNLGLPGSPNATNNAFVMCMKADGSEILWKTDIRTTTGNYTEGRGVEIDAAGNVYVATLTYSGVNQFAGVDPAVGGVLMTVPTGPGTGVMPAIFKLNPAGNQLVYFSYLMDRRGEFVWAYIYDDAHIPMVIDNQGHLVVAIPHKMDRYYNGEFSENAFSPKEGNVFGNMQPKATTFAVISTINTTVSGAAGLLDCGLVNKTVTGMEKDAVGNIYMTGLVYSSRQMFRSTSFADYNPAYFTHQTHNLDYLQNGWAYPTYLLKLSPNQDTVLYGSLVGFERIVDTDDYFEGSYDENLAVSANGDVYITNSYYFYPNNNMDVSYFAHPAPKKIILQDVYDPDCGGWCYMIQTVEKYPAGNYHNPEWMVQYPTSWWYQTSEVEVDAERGIVHILSFNDRYGVPDYVPLATEGALQSTSHTSPTNDSGKHHTHYMQMSTAGDILYATVLSADDVDGDRLNTYPIGVEVNQETGEAYLVRNIYLQDNTKEMMTPSYRDYANNQQVEVFGGDIIPVSNGANKSSIMVFHAAHPGQNIINDFPEGQNEFCVGSLIGIGDAAAPLEGNKLTFKSGDGSSEQHNLPDIYKEGVRLAHPAPAPAVARYQWQRSFRGLTESDFGPWENIPGANKQLLEPQESDVPGTIRYRREVFLDGYTTYSNATEAIISGGELELQINGPTEAIYYCNSSQEQVNISIINAGGNVSWQWYEGYTPIDNSLITPASGTNQDPASFTAAIALGNTRPGFYRLLVTDEASGCKKEFFLSTILLTAPVFSKSEVTFCPGEPTEVRLGPGVVNPAFDYRYIHPDMSVTTVPKPLVSMLGVYTLEVSLVGQNAFCTAAASTVELKPSIGDHDANLVLLTDKGFCEDDAPMGIGLVAAPTTGYSYIWTPGIGLNNTRIANPLLDPAVIAANRGVRSVDYLFKATREIDGCVFTSVMTVSDTTLAIAQIDDGQLYDRSACTPSEMPLRPGDFKGTDFRWRVIATNYPGGLEALQASPDFGVGALGQTEGRTAFSRLYFPVGTYYVDLEFTSSYGIIG